MAEARMPELVKMVQENYHNFPAETWQRTREVLENREPFRLFTHIETLIATRQVDQVLEKNEPFRLLMAEIYGERHVWLHDQDLGDARWGAVQERSVKALRAQAELAEKNPEHLEDGKRELMLRKIVEGGDDVATWAKVLGFEGILFTEKEVVAAATRMRVEAGGPADGYGTGEKREDIGGVEFTTCPEGPDCTYGPPLCFDRNEEPSAQDDQFFIPEVPKAPAEGGPAPRNPFTTEWRARELPGGLQFPDVFDPYYSSNHFIRRSRKYPRPELPRYRDEDSDEGDDATAQGKLAESGSSDSTAVATMASTTYVRPRRPGATGNRRRHAVLQMPGLFTVRASADMNPRIIGQIGATATQVTAQTDTRTISQTSGGAEQTTVPTITVTGTNRQSTDETAPVTEVNEIANSMPAGYLLTPHKERCIFTPSRPWRPLSPPPTITTIQKQPEADVEMVDVEDEREATEDTDPTALSTSWLRNFLRKDMSTNDEDLQMMDYQGWRIHSPRVQLIRIKNFLADEDIDRTLGWRNKFAEIGLFLQYCRDMKDAPSKDWWVDLRECMDMLHVHWLTEQHYYGERELVVEFPKMDTTSTRLPPLLDARDIVVEGMSKQEDMRPRYLVHRVPESIHDVDYQVPGPVLRQTLMTWFREDGNLVWATHPEDEMPGSGPRGQKFKFDPDFNMALTEDFYYMRCMNGGPEETARSIRAEANFYIGLNEYVAGEMCNVDIDGAKHDVQTVYPTGEVQQRFARYRGAKRAALQQCISHFDSVENVAILSPFRKLVLPLTRRQKERAKKEAGVDVVYKPHAIKQPPKGEKLDPMGLLYWHQRLRENHWSRAEHARAGTEDSHKRYLADADLGEDPVLLPKNFLGPIAPTDFLTVSERRIVERHKLLMTLRDKLNRAHKRSPRQMLEGMIKNLRFGATGDEPWDVKDALVMHRTKHGEYLEANDMELYWVDFVTGPSTNVRAEQTPLPNLGREFEVFTTRVQRLLDDPCQDALLARQDRKTELQGLTAAVNVGLRNGDYVLTNDKVKVFETAEDGKVLISRPACEWHPENRIKWPAGGGDDKWDPVDNRWHRANLPSPEETWDWDEAFANSARVNEIVKTTKTMLWAVCYRIGIELARLQERVPRLDDKLSRASEWDFRANQLQDVIGRWISWFKHPRQSGGRPVSYASVVKAGEPRKWKEGLTEVEACEVVRRGIIDELSQGASTLWPSRPRFSVVGGREVQTFHRDRVWDWAAPEVVGVKKQFFSVDRWPVHLQKRETQMDIVMRPSMEAAAEKLDNSRVAGDLGALDERCRYVPTAGQIARRQMKSMLSVPYHEGSRREFFLGKTEYWGGDTPAQKRVIQEHVRQAMAEAIGPNDGGAPRAKGWFGRGRTEAAGSNIGVFDDRRSELPEVDPAYVPRSVPAPPPATSGWLMSGGRGPATSAVIAPPPRSPVEGPNTRSAPRLPVVEKQTSRERKVRFAAETSTEAEAKGKGPMGDDEAIE
ncbi:hypothetical protein CCHL11_07875 [Colletotrichum chlorophyti]|uniref:Uncharacterized protein n=1 Tax=Colletotrichum chlorophyti TaxID=708187 RepID=A0A1Q8RR45_9PEZI|nr:hypothetical protein CCHL11_07875 [Colletotrichum chlorophyti]